MVMAAQKTVRWGRAPTPSCAIDDDCTETDWDTGDDPDEHLYYCQDANFNTTALVERSDGTVVERYVYDPYGKVTIYDDDWSDTVTWANSKKNAYLYSGYRYDHESRLYHVRHRSYHPTLGRWMQRDRIGYADGMGLYEYVRSTPCGSLDAMGLETIWDDQGRPVGRRDPDWINCLGYAMQEDATVQPRGTHGSLASLLEARGWDCRRLVEFEECYCQENEMRMVVVIYQYPGMDPATGEIDPGKAPGAPGGIPDPFHDPWPSQVVYAPDYHAYRGPDGNDTVHGATVLGTIPRTEPCLRAQMCSRKKSTVSRKATHRAWEVTVTFRDIAVASASIEGALRKESNHEWPGPRPGSGRERDSTALSAERYGGVAPLGSRKQLRWYRLPCNSDRRRGD